MERSRRIRSAVILEAALLFLMGVILWENGKLPQKSAVETTADGYIKWVDFNVSYEALSRAYEYDISSYGEKQHLDWIDLLAYVGAKNGGDFGAGATEDMRTAAEKILCGEDTMEHMTADMKMFSYYREAYGAVLGGMVGEYEIQEKEDGSYVKKYGLKAFSPIAKGFEYSDYDDFGVSRSYGYQRQHLGHDMMGQVGTPIIAVESGYVEAIGWNQYGGWRIGIRSFDGKRYYYYAHLESYAEIKEGDQVQAGEMLGFMGDSGYGEEGTTGQFPVHLHLGIYAFENGKEISVNPYYLLRALEDKTLKYYYI